MCARRAQRQRQRTASAAALCKLSAVLLRLLLQVEADIRPFRGLLIGLFFMSVGGSINMEVLKDNYDVILWMLAGLVSLKAAVNIMLGPLFGLSK